MRICKELDKVLAIARDDVVALEMEGYVTECFWVAIDV